MNGVRGVLPIFVGVLALTACGRSKFDDTDTSRTLRQAVQVEHTVTLEVPQSLSVLAPALAASERLGIGAGAEIDHVDGGAPVSSLGTEVLRVEPDAVLNDVWSRGPVDLRDRVRVRGSIHAPNVTVGEGVTLGGGHENDAIFDPPTSLSWQVTYPEQGSPGIDLAPNQTGELAPGRYLGTVRVASGAKLRLQSGVYYLDQTLQLEAQAILELNQSHGPIIIYVDSVQLRGAIISSTGDTPDLLIVALGSQTVFVERSYDGALLAPFASMVLRDVPGGHTGYFAAKTLDVDAGAKVKYRAPLALLAAADLDPSDCSALIPRPANNTREENLRYQELINRYCAIPEADECTSHAVARINVDLADVAFALMGDSITPSQFLAVVRDRSRKRYAFEIDPQLAGRLCSSGDDDGDLVPNGDDACPDTPPLTPTFDDGCTDPALPQAPSSDDVRKLFESGGFLVDPRCEGAEVLPRSVAGGFYYPGIPERGTYILGRRVTNQPPGCPMWYFFDVEEFDLAGPLKRYMVAFRENEEVTALVGGPNPVPGGFIQFNPLPSDEGTRGALGSAGSPNHRVRFRMRVMNGAGMRSTWSDWKLTNQTDCFQLGFHCPPRDIPPRQGE